MKHIHTLLLFAFLLTAAISCGLGGKDTGIIRVADSLSETDMPVAERYIDSIVSKDGSISKKTRMHLLLMKLKIENRTDSLYPSDSLFRAVTEYYADNGDRNERMLSEYIAGCCYVRTREDQRALRCFQKGIEHADTTDTQCDYSTLAKIYARTALLFQDQMSPDYTIEAWDKAYKYGLMARDTLFAILSYSYKSSTYNITDNRDSILHISHNAIKMFKKHRYYDHAAAEYGSLIFVYAENGMPEKAGQYINEYEKKSGMFNENGDIEKGHEIYYYAKGLYLIHENRLDSAERLFRKELRETSDYNNRQAAFKGLYFLYKRRGVTDSIVKYAELWNEMTDSSFFNMSTVHLQRMKAMYDFTASERIAAEKTKEAADAKATVFALALMLLILAMAFYIAHRKKADRIKDLNRENSMSMIMLNKREVELQMLKSGREVDARAVREKEEEIRTLQEKISSLQGEVYSADNWSGNSQVRNAPVIERLHASAAASRKAELGDIEELTSLMMKAYPAFFDFLDIRNNGLTDRDVSVCLLTYLKFMISEISCLLGISAQVLTNQRVKLNKKLFNSNGGAKDFDYRIKTLFASKKRPCK